MATARDKLVADWRQQLHAAQDSLASSPREAWMASVRCRLYRFLLACYGKSPWTTIPARPDKAATAVFDDGVSQFLHGKPAKTAGKIQAVLKAVANAQEPLELGSLPAGLSPHSFVTIATEMTTSNTLAVFADLKREGIPVRHVVRNGVDAIEVQTADFYRARWLLSGFEAQRALRRWPRKGFGHEFVGHVGVALAMAPFAGMFATLMCGTILGPTSEAKAIAFCLASVGWVLAHVACRVGIAFLAGSNSATELPGTDG